MPLLPTIFNCCDNAMDEVLNQMPSPNATSTAREGAAMAVMLAFSVYICVLDIPASSNTIYFISSAKRLYCEHYISFVFVLYCY